MSDAVEDGVGPPCPTCHRPTVKFRHGDEYKPPKDRGYYSYWYRCKTKGCRTTLIMPVEGYCAAHIAENL